MGIIFPISSGLPLTVLPPLLPLSLTSPPGTQKVSLPAGVSCWGEGAGSAKDRFGGVGPQELESGELCEGGWCEAGIRYWGTRGGRKLSRWRSRMGGGLGDNFRCVCQGGGGASYLSKVLGDRQALLQVI